MTRVTVLLLLLSALACSRESASPQPPTTSQPPAAPPASTSPEPAQSPPEAAPTAPGAAGAQPADPPTTPSAETAAANPAPAAVAPATPPPPPAPRFREITVPADTPLSVTLETPLASDTSHVEDIVEGRLARAIVVSHATVLPAGARVTGTVIDVKRSGRVKGRASIALRFTRVVAHGEHYEIQTARVSRQAEASTKSDVKKGGIGAGVGAVVGGIAGGGKGAAIGGVLGGAGTVMATRGKEVQLASGTMLSTRLTSPIDVRVAVTSEPNRAPEP